MSTDPNNKHSGDSAKRPTSPGGTRPLKRLKTKPRPKKSFWQKINGWADKFFTQSIQFLSTPFKRAKEKPNEKPLEQPQSTLPVEQGSDSITTGNIDHSSAVALGRDARAEVKNYRYSIFVQVGKWVLLILVIIIVSGGAVSIAFGSLIADFLRDNVLSPPARIEIVLDVSQRMGDKFEDSGKTKLEVAREAILKLLKKNEGLEREIALRLMYRSGEQACETSPATSLAVDFTQDYDQIRQALQNLPPENNEGDAPLVKTLEDAVDHLKQNRSSSRALFIFTGGDEECGESVQFLFELLEGDFLDDSSRTFLILLGGEEEPEWAKQKYGHVSLALAKTEEEVQNTTDDFNNQIPPTPTLSPVSEVVQGGVEIAAEVLDRPSQLNPQLTPLTLTPTTGKIIANAPTVTPLPSFTPTPTHTPFIPPTFTSFVPTTGTADTSRPTTPPTSPTLTPPPQLSTDVTPTHTQTNTATLTATSTLGISLTPSPTFTASYTPLPSFTPTPSRTPTATRTFTATTTATATFTPVPTNTPTPIPPTATPTNTLTPTLPPPYVATPLPSQTHVFLPGCPLINEARVFAQFYQGQASISADLVLNGHTDQGLRLNFSNVSAVGGNYAGWEVWLGENDQSGIDLSPYSSLVFYIRGSNGGEEPNVYLMMPRTETNYDRFWKDVELVTPVTTSWQQVVIPLSHFTSSQVPNEQVALNNIQRIQILFEWYAQPTSGEIFIDDLCVQ